MKNLLFTLALFCAHVGLKAQVKPANFSLYYNYAGLGSNMGSMQPVIRINETHLVYTYEQNSYYEKKTKQPDTICMVELRNVSIDSIIAIVKPLGDSTVYETNPCIMSGGIHRLAVIVNNDTTDFTLHNTFDRTALQITRILNAYLPMDKKIWAGEHEIIECEKCWVSLRKKWDKEKEGKK